MNDREPLDPSRPESEWDPSPPDRLWNGQKRCKATCSHARHRGKPCMQPAVTGADVCKMHGGSIKRVKKAGVRRAQKEKWSKIMTTVLGVDAPIEGSDPLSAVLSEIAYAASACAWLRSQIAELNPSEAVWGTTREVEGLEERQTTREAKPHVLVAMLAEWSDRLVSHCRAAGALGIDQSMIAVVEAHGVRAAVALERLLAGESSIEPETRGRLLAALPEALRAGESR